MSAAWEWWAGIVGEPIYNVAGGCKSREDVIREALANVSADEEIQIIEAQMSTARKYEDSDEVPFIRTRNHEIIGKKGPCLAAPSSEGGK